MSDRRDFMTRVLAGETRDLDLIDREIAEWHRSSTDVPLHDWLGMTSSEYALFVERPDSLRFIVMARKSGQDVRDLLKSIDGKNAVAARDASPQDVAEIRRWLEKTGRL